MYIGAITAYKVPLVSPVERKEGFPIGQVNQRPTEDKRVYSVAEITKMLGISKKKAYDLCESGNFNIVRIGRAIRISKSSFDGWINNN